MLRVEPGGSKKPVVVSRPASPRPTPPSKPTGGPVLISEHGHGGGSGAADTGRKPTAAETRAGYTAPSGTKPATVQPTPAPRVVSEHGQSGGSSSGDTGRKPTPAETSTGYAAPAATKAAAVQPTSAATLTSEHGRGGGSSSGDTGRKPAATETRTGYAVQAEPKSHQAHGIGGFFHQVASEVSHATSSVKRDVSKGVHVVEHDASPAIHAIRHEAATVAKTLKHLGTRATRASEGVAVNTGRLIEYGAETIGKAELHGLRADLELGEELGDAVKNNPATVAWVAGTLALLIPVPPLDVALAIVSAVASADASEQALRERRYVEFAFDLTAVAGGVGGLGARPLEGLANAEHAATAARLNTLTDGLAAAKGEAVPPLSDDQESALGRLVQELDRTRGRARSMRELRHRADLTAALAAFLGDPRVDPAARVRRR